MADADDFARALETGAVRAPLAVPGALSLTIRPTPAKETTPPQATGASREGTIAFWVGKGAPQHVAEGIADRVNAESGFRPTIEGDKGTSIGLYQHHADRKARLMALPNWQDPNAQHEHAYSEVTGGDPIAAKHWDEIQAAPNRQTAAHLWDKYFERSKGSQSAPWEGQTTATGHFKPSANSIAFAQNRGGDVEYVDARDFLAMLPPIADNAREKRKGASLLKSLLGGDEVEAVPTVDVTVKDGKAKITDYDGRHRAEEAIKAGVDLIPVSFRGLPKGERPSEIEGMTGVTLPFNFTPVPPRAQPVEGPAQRIAAAAGRGATEAFQGFDPGLKPDVRAALSGMAPGFGKEAATAGVGALRAAGLPFDVIGRAVNAALMGAARGGGQAIGEVTGAAREPGFDPGIGAIREVIQPGMAFLGGVGMMPGAGLPRGAAEPRAAAPASLQPANAMVAPMRFGGPELPARQAAIENQARALVGEKFNQDIAGGEITMPDVLSRIDAGRAEGQPLTPLDVGGENVKGLAGTAYRAPGEGRSAMAARARERAEAASPWVKGLIRKYIGEGAVADTAEALIERQSAEARPLWEKAREGGSAEALPAKMARDYQRASGASDKAKAAYEKAASAAQDMERAAADQNVRVPREPTRLTTFLIRNGGLQESRGELSYVLGGNKGRPGLINKDGRSLDDAALDAWEAGYLSGAERPTVDDLINAIGQDVNRQHVYSEIDVEAAAEYRAALDKNRETSRRTDERPGPDRKRITPREVQFAQDKGQQTEAAWRAAEDTRADVQSVMERAREDGTLGAKGATWSPGLERLRQTYGAEIQSALNEGMAIEKRKHAADVVSGKRFELRDYAVIGEDAEGNPIVGAVPTMASWMVAKEGLDAIIEGMRNELRGGRPTKRGLSYMDLRSALVGELDRVNPYYKAARDKWSGDMSSISAVKDGREAFDKGRWYTPAELKAHVDKLTAGDRELFKLGTAEKLQSDLRGGVDAADKGKRVINNEERRERVAAVLGDEASAEKFLAGIQRISDMRQRDTEVMRGSQTAGRAAEDAAARLGDMARGGVDVAMGVGHAAHGNILSAGASALRLLARSTKGKPLDPQVYAAVGRLLSDPGLKMIEDMRGNMLIPPVRSIPERGRATQFLIDTAGMLPKVQSVMKAGAMNAMQNFAVPPQ